MLQDTEFQALATELMDTAEFTDSEVQACAAAFFAVLAELADIHPLHLPVPVYPWEKTQEVPQD